MIERADADLDAAALHEIARRTFADATPPGTDPQAIEDFVASVLSEQAFRGHLSDPAVHVLIARRSEGADRAAIGYALLLEEKPLPVDGAQLDLSQPVLQGKGLFLSKFYLLPESRGTGAAGLLMEACRELGRSQGADFLWLTVNDLNARANAFYERAGLRRVGSSSFPLGEQIHNDHVRAAALPPTPTPAPTA